MESSCEQTNCSAERFGQAVLAIQRHSVSQLETVLSEFDQDSIVQFDHEGTSIPCAA